MTVFSPLPLYGNRTYGVATGSKLQMKPRVLVFEGGDGQTQRTIDGINANPKAGTLRFTNLQRGEAVILDQFFSGLMAVTPFTWTVPGEATPRQWLATAWDRSFDNKAIENMSATIEENFDP